VNLTHGIVWGSSATFKATYIQLSNFGFSDGFVSAIHWRERLLPYLQQELQRVMQSMTRVKTPLVETLKQTLNIIFYHQRHGAGVCVVRQAPPLTLVYI
jgi:hypothetical protein